MSPPGHPRGDGRSARPDRFRASTTRAAAACAAWFVALAAVAETGADAAAQRQALRAERADIEARFQSAERDCRTRFVVSSCLEDAQAERRRSLAGVHQRELALDEAVRRAETERHGQRLQAKREAAASAPAPTARAHAAPASSAPPGAPRPPDVASRERRGAQEAAAAASRAAARNAREAKAQARREAAAEKEAQRKAEQTASGRPPVAPLPLPQVASQPLR